VCIFAMHIKLDYKCPNFLSSYLKHAFLQKSEMTNDNQLNKIYENVTNKSLSLFKTSQNTNDIVLCLMKYIDDDTQNLTYYFPESSFQDIINKSQKIKII
jgi:hypothetical protein